MDIQSLTNRALEIREQYAGLEINKIGRTWTGAELAQGFAGDVGELMKIVMAKEGLRSYDDVDSALEHELADCLWSILVIAHHYGVDIEKSFTNTMIHLEQRIQRERI